MSTSHDRPVGNGSAGVVPCNCSTRSFLPWVRPLIAAVLVGPLAGRTAAQPTFSRGGTTGGATELPRRKAVAAARTPSQPVRGAYVPAPDDILIADFESGSYGDWQVEGEAFGTCPGIANVTPHNLITGQMDECLVNSYLGGDGPTGTLTSPEFTIQRTFLCFLVGGGSHAGKTCMNLLVAGSPPLGLGAASKPVRTAVGSASKDRGHEIMAWVCWDVAEFAGKKAKLRIVDSYSGGWGHINIDHIVQSNRALKVIASGSGQPARVVEGPPLGSDRIKLGAWHRIGPFRDQPPLTNWMDNVASSARHAFAVEKEAMAGQGEPDLSASYPAPNFPATPGAVRGWTAHPDWIDGYYQELPRGPAPSAGESQYLYRTITASSPGVIELDFVLRSPESDRRMNGKGMEHWRRTGRYKWMVNGEVIVRWEGRGDMPKAQKVALKKGINHFLAKVTNNRHSYGLAFSIKGLHPELRHEVGFERMWRPHIKDLPTELPYAADTPGAAPGAAAALPAEQRYREALQRLRALRFHPVPMPGVEHAARDRLDRVVPAMEKALEHIPTSPAGDRHTARLAELEAVVRPLLRKIDETGETLETEVFGAVGLLDGMWEAAIREMPPLVYLERPTYVYDSMMYEGAGTRDAAIKSFDPRSRQIETIFDLKSEKVRAGANEISLSWDGTTIYIGGNRAITAIDRDGGNYRRITSGQSPSELPDGRIVFFDSDVGQAPCKSKGARRLLFICDPDGSNRKLVSANLCIDTAPTVMNDGRVIFTRWDYGVNKNVFNRHALWAQNPDGTGIELFFGNTIVDPRAFCRPHQIPGRPEVLTIFGPHHSKLAGLLGLVWNGAGTEACDGLGFRRITHDTASVGDKPQPWSYQDPYPLNEQLFLVSFGGRPGSQAALYLYDRSGNRKCLLESAGPRGIHSARPFVARQRPPIRPDCGKPPVWEANVDLHQRLLEDPDWTQKGTLFLQDVYQGLTPEIKRGQIKYLAVMEQPAQSHGRGGAIGVGTIWYVNRFLGLVPVEPDGSAYFQVPALRSLFFHALDEDGRMLMTQGSDFHVMPGEARSCVGCHEQRKGIRPPDLAATTPVAMTRPAVRPKLPDWGTRGIIEYEAVVQPVFDRYCIRCHSGKRPANRLDLTGDLTTAYSMSYMQLTDGGYVHFTPGTGRTHAQPSNDCDEQAPLSRGSVLSKLADVLQDPGHCGKEMAFDDRLRVLLWIDSNVPFFSHYRQVPPASLTAESRRVLADVHTRRCASCHHPRRSMPDEKSGLNASHIARHVGGPAGQWGIAPSGMRVRHLNLSKPAHSAALQAPLAKGAGGWGLCLRDGKAVFQDTADADYQAALKALEDGVVRREGIEVQGVSELLRRQQAAVMQ